MSGFIANGQQHDQAPIVGDGFWPVIEPAVVAATVRIGGELSQPRLRAALLNAVMVVNAELTTYRHDQEAAGHARLEDVPSNKLDGETLQVHRYRRAVACALLAEIHERYRSFDATASGQQRADDLTPSIDECRRDLRWAIRDFLGKPRNTVDLI